MGNQCGTATIEHWSLAQWSGQRSQDQNKTGGQLLVNALEPEHQGIYELQQGGCGLGILGSWALESWQEGVLPSHMAKSANM